MPGLTTGEVLKKASAFFKEKGCESPRLSAELLLAEVLQTDRIHLYMDFQRPLTNRETDQYRELVRRRAQGEPVAYLLSRKEFYALPFHVGRGVLIPRPETEILVQAALSLLNKCESPNVRIWDVGTGSGVIAVCLAHEKETLQVIGTDISCEALSYARKNAEANKVSDRTEFYLAEVDSAMEDGERKRDFERALAEGFDLIVSNPPYIPSGEIGSLQWEVRDWEPREALDGGPDGLDVLRGIVTRCESRLKLGGQFVFEIGETQLERIVKEYGEEWSIKVTPDLAGVERVVVLTKQ